MESCIKNVHKNYAAHIEHLEATNGGCPSAPMCDLCTEWKKDCEEQDAIDNVNRSKLANCESCLKKNIQHEQDQPIEHCEMDKWAKEQEAKTIAIEGRFVETAHYLCIVCGEPTAVGFNVIRANEGNPLEICYRQYIYRASKERGMNERSYCSACSILSDNKKSFFHTDPGFAVSGGYIKPI